MELHVDVLEGFWIFINATAMVVTFFAAIDAWRSAKLVPDEQRARTIIARGNFRREVLRLTIQGLLLTIVIPGLTVDRPVPLNPIVVVLIAVPTVLLIQTLADAWDRRKLAGVSLGDIEAERTGSLSRLEAAIAGNTALTEKAVDGAERAYSEANEINHKIADLQQRLLNFEKRLPPPVEP